MTTTVGLMKMSIPERLEKQRVLLSWLEYQVHTTRETIRRLEKEQVEEERRREVAHREMRWKLQPARAVEGRPMLHRGNCGQYNRGGGLLDRDEVKVAVQQFPGLEWCDICKPWGSLDIDRPPAVTAGPPAEGDAL
ncbi:DUF6233 domain-containing protein [Streptomyces sp. NPDC056222]|uniref:DUF6233 domain-containing protein n=1 Tax=Streptomyces sp. NPDC056222 TaxID=3345749 RepID=UPI0035D72D31